MNVVDHCTEHSLSDHDFLDISLSRLTCNVERVLDEDCGEGLMAGDGSINSSSGSTGIRTRRLERAPSRDFKGRLRGLNINALALRAA
jgi:hypothetical protein